MFIYLCVESTERLKVCMNVLHIFCWDYSKHVFSSGKW